METNGTLNYAIDPKLVQGMFATFFYILNKLYKVCSVWGVP